MESWRTYRSYRSWNISHPTLAGQPARAEGFVRERFQNVDWAGVAVQDSVFGRLAGDTDINIYAYDVFAGNFINVFIICLTHLPSAEASFFGGGLEGRTGFGRKGVLRYGKDMTGQIACRESGNRDFSSVRARQGLTMTDGSCRLSCIHWSRGWKVQPANLQ